MDIPCFLVLGLKPRVRDPIPEAYSEHSEEEGILPSWGWQIDPSGGQNGRFWGPTPDLTQSDPVRGVLTPDLGVQTLDLARSDPEGVKKDPFWGVQRGGLKGTPYLGLFGVLSSL